MLLDEQKRQLTLALQPVEPVEQGVDYNRGQAFERLVHQQQCRIAHQGTPDRHWNWWLSWTSCISSSRVEIRVSAISTCPPFPPPTGDRPALDMVGRPKAVGG
jgi:hypothetical protein